LDFIGLFIGGFSAKMIDTSVHSSDIGDNWIYLDFIGLFISGFSCQDN